MRSSQRGKVQRELDTLRTEDKPDPAQVKALEARVAEFRQPIEDLGRHFGADLYAREVGWLMDEEWARAPADVLWRRSKLGLRLSQAEHHARTTWMAGRRVTLPDVLPPIA